MISNEQILLGAWLRGDNLEDMHLIKEEMMAERDIFKMLRSGKNLLEIAEKTRRTDLTEWTSHENSNEYFYRPALKRLLKNQMYYLIQNKQDPKEIVKTIEEMTRAESYKIEPCKSASELVAYEMMRRVETKNPRYDGLDKLNQLTNGIKRKELTVIAARPSVGKSAIGLQIAHGVAKQGHRVSYFPLEMSVEQTYMRLMCQNGYLTSQEMQTGKVRDVNVEKYNKGLDWLRNLQGFDVYEGVNNIEDILTIAERDKPYLIVIDQLSQLRASKPFGTLREQFSYMTSTLKTLTLKGNVAVMLLCQINRSADDSEPTMANLKESGSIEEDSDNVILLHQERKDIESQKRRVQIHLAKQRDGATGSYESQFYPGTFRFYEENY